jgi:tetratricopeptide (TPR) repeat protein
MRAELVHRRRIEGDESLTTLASLNQLATILVDQRKFAEAEPLFREELSARRRVQGGDHPHTLAAALNLSFALNRIGQIDAAESLTRETLAAQRRVLGDGDPHTVASLNNLGGLLFDQGKFAEAEPLFRDALRARIRIYGEAHPETLGTTSNLARTLRALGRIEGAEALFATLYKHSATAPLPPKQAALFMSHWGPSLATLGRYAAAEAPLNEALARLEATQQTGGEHMRRVLAALADVCDHTTRPDEAARWRSKLKAIDAPTRPATTVPN